MVLDFILSIVVVRRCLNSCPRRCCGFCRSVIIRPQSGSGRGGDPLRIPPREPHCDPRAPFEAQYPWSQHPCPSLPCPSPVTTPDSSPLTESGSFPVTAPRSSPVTAPRSSLIAGGAPAGRQRARRTSLDPSRVSESTSRRPSLQPSQSAAIPVGGRPSPEASSTHAVGSDASQSSGESPRPPSEFLDGEAVRRAAAPGSAAPLRGEASRRRVTAPPAASPPRGRRRRRPRKVAYFLVLQWVAGRCSPPGELIAPLPGHFSRWG